MICNNCGAEIKEHDSKCPYCGSLNPLGAEAVYLEKLENIREDTEDLKEVPAEQYEQHLKYHGTFVLKTALMVIGICIAVCLLIFTVSSCTKMKEKGSIREEFDFQKEYFPLLDELYQSGDDAQVFAYLNELYKVDGSSALYHWEHHTYYVYYDLSLSVQNTKDAMENNTYSTYDVINGFYAAMSLAMEGIWESDYYSLSEEEIAKITDFQQEAAIFLSDYFDLTDETSLQEAYALCREEGFLDYKRCENYVTNYMED